MFRFTASRLVISYNCQKNGVESLELVGAPTTMLNKTFLPLQWMCGSRTWIPTPCWMPLTPKPPLRVRFTRPPLVCISQRSPPLPAWAVSASWFPKIVTTERKVFDTTLFSSRGIGGCVTNTIGLVRFTDARTGPTGAAQTRRAIQIPRRRDVFVSIRATLSGGVESTIRRTAYFPFSPSSAKL